MMHPAKSLVLLALGASPALAQPAPNGAPLTLEQAVQRAAENGPAGRAALQAVRAARWRDKAFDARLMPQLSLDAVAPNLNRAIVPVVQPDGKTLYLAQRQMESSFSVTARQPLPFSGGSLFVSTGLSRLDVYGDKGATRLYQSSPVIIGITQGIFRPNRLAWDSREQSLNSDAAERRWLEAREDVSTQAVAAFFDVYSAQVTEENAATNVAVNDSLYTLSKGRLEVGKIGENDLLQSELALLRARASLDAAKLATQRARAALAVTLGIAPDALGPIAPPAQFPEFTADPDKAAAEALRNRSSMVDLELQDVQASRRVREAQLNNRFGATVTATAGLNQTAPSFGTAYNSLLDQQRVSVNVQMPIVQWRAGHAEVEAARADRERTEFVAKNQRATLEQDARFAALEIPLDRRQLDLAIKADSVGAKRFEIAKNRYVIGKIGIDNLYIAQSEKDAARQSLVQAMRSYWLGYYRLRRLTLYDFAANKPLTAEP
ncbi:outer membrane efflux protein [Gemmatirosa kalamazoonensis]|uniref:Outer membrane efflux protein n=1 Tax=Gemmatirosa kalamazoonensis TaxID=861299 RepID=W0REI3_9BACT|nr:TolC family protein [Gemmatirosa kalamazoonensis]AHG88857.1 outer membrane efflux protein [Gemmatirosa kalamazoonensis]